VNNLNKLFCGVGFKSSSAEYHETAKLIVPYDWLFDAPLFFFFFLIL
jgi:hypothetical protein